jgi:hypothetical protein
LLPHISKNNRFTYIFTFQISSTIITYSKAVGIFESTDDVDNAKSVVIFQSSGDVEYAAGKLHSLMPGLAMTWNMLLVDFLS